jgi:hypothetical protein
MRYEPTRGISAAAHFFPIYSSTFLFLDTGRWRPAVKNYEEVSHRQMKTSVMAMTKVRRFRLPAMAIGGALAMTLATQASANTAPTAAATISPSAVWEDDTVTLNATASHTNPSGGPLDYLWQQQVPSSPMICLRQIARPVSRLTRLSTHADG